MKKHLILSFFLGFALIFAACGAEDTGGQDSGNDESEANAEEPANDDESAEEPASDEDTNGGKYGLGDTAEVGGVKVTITNVSLTDERNEFADDDPNMVVKIEYEMENNTDDEIPVGADFQVYDGTGNQVDSYPLDNTMGSLKPGKKLQGVEHYGIEEGPIEVYFQPMFSFEEDAIFELEVE